MDNANNNNKVTIDAAWFAELYTTAKLYDVAARTVASLAQERDELKAKVAEHAELLQRTEAERVALKAKLAAAEKSVESLDAAFCNDERLAAAERCIEEVWVELGTIHRSLKRQLDAIENIIRAYRAQKEAK